MRKHGVVAVIVVKPGEGYPHPGHDWSAWLPNGVTVQTVTALGTDLTDQSVVTNTLITNLSTANGVTTFEVQGLTDGRDYSLKLSMTRSDGGGPVIDEYLIRCRKGLV